LHVWTGSSGSLWSNSLNWNGGAPAVGEGNVVLTFPQSAAQKTNVDDIPGLIVQQINFTGAGYDLTGSNPLSLVGGIADTTSSSGTPGATNLIAINLQLAGTVTMQVADPSRAVRITGTVSNGGIVTATGGSADLSVTQTGPATANAGSNLTYTVTVTDNGPDSAQNVALVDAVPAGSTFLSAAPVGSTSFSCAAPPSPGTSGTVTCTAASLASGGSATFRLVFQAGGTGATVTNDATAISGTPDPTPGNNSATVATAVTPQADLALTNTGPAAVTPGTQITYTLSLTNNGPSDAQGVTLTDAVPQGAFFAGASQPSGPPFTCVNPSGSAPFTCVIGDFPAGQSATFTVSLFLPSSAPGGTTLTNTAQVSAATADPSGANNTASSTASVNTKATLGITKTGPGSITAGTDITYTLTVSNDGPSDATNVVLTDAVPNGTTFGSELQTGGPTFTCGGVSPGGTGTLTCNAGSLAAGAVASFDVVMHALSSDASGLVITNTAQLTATGAGQVSVSSQGTVATAFDVGVTVTGPASVTEGSNATFSITVTSNGPSDAPNVTLTDMGPTGSTSVTVNQISGQTIFNCPVPGSGPSTITCTAPSMPAGQSAVIQYVLNIPVGAASPISDIATVSTSPTDTNPNNDTASATVFVNRLAADLAVTKTGPSSVVAGGHVTYDISVTNNGPDDAQNVTLTDAVPNFTTFGFAELLNQPGFQQNSGPTFNCTTPSVASTGTVQCTIATLAAGQSATFQMFVEVNSSGSAAGPPPSSASVTNTATVSSSSTFDPDTANNSATVNSPNAAGILTVNGTAGNDTLVLLATSTNSGMYFLNGAAPPVSFSGISQFVFNGNGGNDTFTINNGAFGGVFAPSGGIQFNNGSSSQDVFQYLGGSAITGTFTAGATPDAGTLVRQQNSGAFVTIDFTGLANLTDTVSDEGFTVNAPAGNDTLNVVDGPVVGGAQTTEFNSPSFATVDVANKLDADLVGGSGNDTFTVNATTPAAGLTDLVVDAGSGFTLVQVVTTPAGITTTVNGNSGASGFFVANVQGTSLGSTLNIRGQSSLTTVNLTNAGSVQGILGTVNIENPPTFNAITIDDSADTTGRMVTLASQTSSNPDDSQGNNDTYGTITGLAPGTINYEYKDTNSLNINGGGGGNNFTVTGWGGAFTTLNAGAGNDTIRVAGAPNLPGNLLSINGQGGMNALTLDFSSIPTATPLTIAYDGGNQAGDSLALINLNVATLQDFFFSDTGNGHRGSINVGSATVNYTGLRPVSLSGTIQTLVFFLPNSGGDNKAILQDNGNPGDNVSEITSGAGTFETTTFTNPTGSLTVVGSGGGDTITVAPLDPGLKAPVQVDAGGGTSTLVVDFSGGSNSIPSGGLDLQGGGIVFVPGYAATSITDTYVSAAAGSGLINVDGRTLSYIFLDPHRGIVDPLSAADRTFNFASSGNLITLGDDATPNNGISRITSAFSSPQTDFANPIGSITVNAGRGSDTVNAGPIDASGAPTINLNGVDGLGDPHNAGPDTFNVTPSPVSPIHVSGGQATAPPPPGNTLNVNPAGTTSPFLTFGSAAAGFTGSYTFGNRQPVDFLEIETLGLPVDLAVTQTDNQTTAVPGTKVTYTITVTNNGPLGFGGATVTDTFPAAVASATWTCTATAGSSCGNASGSGNINETDTLQVGGKVTYTVVATIASSATGNLINTAAAAPPQGLGESNPLNNSAIDIDALTPQTNLVLTNTGPSLVAAGSQATYTLSLSNAGPSPAQTVTLTDALPQGTTFVSVTAPSPFICSAPSPGTTGVVSCSAPTLAGGASATFTVAVQVNATVLTIQNAAVAASSTTDTNTQGSVASATSHQNLPGSGGVGAVTKTGAGTLELDVNNTYTGMTTVAAGLLLVNGNQSSSAAVVGNGGTLGGKGETGPVVVNAGGHLVAESDAGHTPSVFTVGGTLTLVAGAELDAYLNGRTQGSQYGTVKALGAVNLGGATLKANFSFDPGLSGSFALLAPIAAGPIAGTFANLAEGAVLTGLNLADCLAITYRGGDGNDVVINAIDTDLLFVEAVLEALNLPTAQATTYAALLHAPANLSRPQLVNKIWTSLDHSTALLQSFLQGFVLTPSAKLQNKLVKDLQAGVREGLVAIEFVTSKEFRRHYRSNRAFVSAVYQGLFEKPIPKKLRKQLVRMLAAGASRATVVALMLSNPVLDEEALRRSVKQLFDPSFVLPGGVHDSLIGQMQSGQLDAEGLFSFFTTQQFVNDFLAHFKALCRQQGPSM
jgi:uncharacterized repeat protein (TIGR01451 family)